MVLIQFADTATPLFKEKLHRFAVQGRWAPDYVVMGWGEGTTSARMGMTNSNMTLVSPAHPEFRKLLIEQFVQLAKDGADGFQIDKTNVAFYLDFNPDLPTSPDKSLTSEQAQGLTVPRPIPGHLGSGSENGERRALFGFRRDEQAW